MPIDAHERARLLVDRAMAEGVSADEQRWLAQHLAECDACGRRAELTRRAARALDAFAFEVDPARAARVQATVIERAGRMGSTWAAPVAAIALTAAGSMAVWEAAAWAAGRWNWPAAGWQAAFALVWLLPSLLVDAAVLLRGKWMDEGGGL